MSLTSEVASFFPKYEELQNTSQQEMPPYSTGKMVSWHLFNETDGSLSQNLIQKSIEKDTARDIVGLLDEKKGMFLLGFWTSVQNEITIRVRYLFVDVRWQDLFKKCFWKILLVTFIKNLIVWLVLAFNLVRSSCFEMWSTSLIMLRKVKKPWSSALHFGQ